MEVERRMCVRLAEQLVRPTAFPSDMRQSQKPGIISAVRPTRPAAAIF
jgi:hypothetical protein